MHVYCVFGLGGRLSHDHMSLKSRLFPRASPDAIAHSCTLALADALTDSRAHSVANSNTNAEPDASTYQRAYTSALSRSIAQPHPR